MRKVLVLAGLVGVLSALPATADAASFRGVLVAKDPARQAVVAATANGTARTVYVGSALRRLPLGQKAVITAQPLPNGAFLGQRIRLLGRAKQARLRAVIARDLSSQGRYLVSAGRSTFALRMAKVRRLTAAEQTPLAPGTEVVANVTPTPSGPTAGSVTPVGQAAAVPLHGIFLGVSGNMLQIAVVGKGLVNLAIPTGFVLPALSPGQLVSVTATPGPTGELVLGGIQQDTPPQMPPNGIHITITIVNNNTNTNNNTNNNTNGGGNGGGDDHDDDSDSDS